MAKKMDARDRTPKLISEYEISIHKKCSVLQSIVTSSSLAVAGQGNDQGFQVLATAQYLVGISPQQGMIIREFRDLTDDIIPNERVNPVVASAQFDEDLNTKYYQPNKADPQNIQTWLNAIIEDYKFCFPDEPQQATGFTIRRLAEAFIPNTTLDENASQYTYTLGAKGFPSLVRQLELGRKASEGDIEARNQLIEAHLALVPSIAKKYVRENASLSDLIGEGNIGLIWAAHKYDYRKGFRFSTYATWWIKQAMTRYLLTKIRTGHLPISVMENITKVKRVMRKIEEEGNNPTPEAIGLTLGMSPEQVVELLQYAEPDFSLDKPVSDDDNSTLGDTLEETENGSAKETNQQQLKMEIFKVLAQLTVRERQVIQLRFGLLDDRSHTLEEVGKALKITRERVRQLEIKALRKLRESDRSKLLTDYLE